MNERQTLRDTLVQRGSFYNPWLHLGVTSVAGLLVMGLGVALLEQPGWEHLLFGVVLFILSNAAEWRIHRDLLHRRQKFAALLYDRHTPEHHVVFVTEDMEIRSRREFKLVLLPAFGIVMLAVTLLPAIWMIWHGWPFKLLSDHHQHNLAGVFAIVTMGYVVTYEWLHLSYHLPASSFIGGLRLIRWLRRHHAHHHNPKLMQKWNFNVSLPLWDWLRRTYVRPSSETGNAGAVVTPSRTG